MTTPALRACPRAGFRSDWQLAIHQLRRAETLELLAPPNHAPLGGRWQSAPGVSELRCRTSRLGTRWRMGDPHRGIASLPWKDQDIGRRSYGYTAARSVMVTSNRRVSSGGSSAVASSLRPPRLASWPPAATTTSRDVPDHAVGQAVIEGVEHCMACRAGQRTSRGQHRATDAVLVADRGGVDAVARSPPRRRRTSVHPRSASARDSHLKPVSVSTWRAPWASAMGASIREETTELATRCISTSLRGIDLGKDVIAKQQPTGFVTRSISHPSRVGTATAQRSASGSMAMATSASISAASFSSSSMAPASSRLAKGDGRKV